MKSSPRSPQLEKARMQQQRPNSAKNLKKKKKKDHKETEDLNNTIDQWTQQIYTEHCTQQ